MEVCSTQAALGNLEKSNVSLHLSDSYKASIQYDI